MTTTTARAELLRPWAEAPCRERRVIDGFEVACVKGQLVATRKATWGETAWEPCECAACGGDGYDPLYAALRGEHEYVQRWPTHEAHRCRYCDYVLDQSLGERERDPGCLRTDVGSVLRAAAACGLVVLESVLVAVRNALWNDEAFEAYRTKGDTRAADAVAAALVAALPERAS